MQKSPEGCRPVATSYLFCFTSFSVGTLSDWWLNGYTAMFCDAYTDKCKVVIFFLPVCSAWKIELTCTECVFTCSLVEHNLMSVADHAGSLFKKMFHISEVFKYYGFSRTKTTAIMNEMAVDTSVNLQDMSFSVASDYSNHTDRLWTNFSSSTGGMLYRAHHMN
ncbi:hypothetical protein PR048_020557 [Dryococelus australis]|uniref:Uncharacterized protein n=1 Tax=Dryococelus australis TaxID=614101 RepID=A0ABQ9H6S9_9NEOP|nr:hypothetical protein PR048_020557 [Dryococelus australis]